MIGRPLILFEIEMSSIALLLNKGHKFYFRKQFFCLQMPKVFWKRTSSLDPLQEMVHLL